MERARVVHSLAVPALDLICNHGGFFQRETIKQQIDFCGRGRVRQTFVCDRANNFVSQRRVGINGSTDRNEDQSSQDSTMRKVHGCAAPVKTSATHRANGIARKILQTRFHQSPEELREHETKGCAPAA